jgi:hypothetical protein
MTVTPFVKTQIDRRFGSKVAPVLGFMNRFTARAGIMNVRIQLSGEPAQSVMRWPAAF